MKNLKDLKNTKSGSIKRTILKSIKKTKFLNNELKWVILNFSFSLLILIICISSMISTNNGNLPKILVYGVYLPLALAHISFSVILSLIAIKSDTPNFYKKWYFYLPLVSILIESIVLPIPLNLITQNNGNAGVLWSTVIFGFAVIILAIVHFSVIYKNNLNDMSVVLPEEDEEFERKEVKQESKTEEPKFTFEKEITQQEEPKQSTTVNTSPKEDTNNNLEINAETPIFDITDKEHFNKPTYEEVTSNINKSEEENTESKNNSLDEN